MTRFQTLAYYSFLVASFCSIPQATAQVTSDNTLATTVNSPNKIDFIIEGGEPREGNLFHSFREFSIPNGGSASFNNAVEIENIFSRVTGGDVSNIEGAISANGNANLFLINPAGIMFGENASLNIGGSFFATTADSLLFPEGEFNAKNITSQPLLTINRPIGLRFGANPDSIVNRSGTLADSTSISGGLELAPGRNLTLVGGEIVLDGGYLATSGGKIELGSVAQAAQVSLDATKSDLVLGYEALENLGDIQLSNLGRIDTSGLGGGEVRLWGRNIILTGGSKITSDTFGNISGENITIDAANLVRVSGTTDIPGLIEPVEAQFGIIVPLRSSITSNTVGGGDAGDIAIATKQLIVEDGGQITASTLFVSDTATMAGAGGDITIEAEDVAVNRVVAVGEGGLDLFGLGRLGIEINGASAIGTVSGNTAKAGKIAIDTHQLKIADGGIITTTSFGSGAGGNLMIEAAESIDIAGKSPSNVVVSAIVASASTTGVSGDVRITTPQLEVKHGGQISAQTSGTGSAGNLEINTRNLLLDNGILTAETQAGDRGNININNASTILLRNNSQITTNATELSTGGDINLSSDVIAALNNSDITAIAEAGQGGNIQINTQGLFLEPDSEITAASELGIDGMITFNTPEVDPTSGIFQLPDVPVNTEAILAQDLCRVENETVAGGSSFIITGRGGLTPTSAESLSNLNRVVGWADESELEVSRNGAVELSQRTQGKKTSYPAVRQSQGLVTTSDGSVWLVANASQTIPQNSGVVHPSCQARLQ
ncbi:filamentous hemagglutinin N-terminal domain-containing protein [Pleurocapsales cyanobacterium LEGE 10410]|nr:filamentous hemagglutinin N-terminal domain-containing protein [Pleurocapsales cyanobacterium LEGE 10410]